MTAIFVFKHAHYELRTILYLNAVPTLERVKIWKSTFVLEIIFDN